LGCWNPEKNEMLQDGDNTAERIYLVQLEKIQREKWDDGEVCEPRVIRRNHYKT